MFFVLKFAAAGLEIKFATNLKYLSLLELNIIKLQNTGLFMNGFIYIFTPKN